jgi:hypothetical protein
MAERAERRLRRRTHRRRIGLLIALVAIVVFAAGVGVVLASSSSNDTASSSRSVDASRPDGTTSTSTSATTTAPTTTTTVDPQTLPQTEDRPAVSSPALDARAQALWQAIVADDPAQATPFFFPLGAYIQVKGIQDPASDWTSRLLAAYEGDVHAAHATLGDAAATATFGGISVPDTGQWVTPGQEYNKGSYWRVYGAKLDYTANGASGSFTIASMISWRGEWYVVHFARIA